MNPLPAVTKMTNLNEFEIPHVDMILITQQIAYQNRSVTSSNIQIDGSDTNDNNNVNDKPEPVIAKVP